VKNMDEKKVEHKMSQKQKTVISYFIIFFLILYSVPAQPLNPGNARPSGALPEEAGDFVLSEDVDTWIVRWEDEIDPEFVKQSIITGEQDFLNVTVAKPRDGIDLSAWLERWKQSPKVRYIQPNQQVKTAATTNDPLRAEQRYLDMIGAYTAWDHVRSNTAITIAVIDTGIDLDHPDLAANLVAGYNFIDRTKPPDDDNGHGTNVAGILAAIGNNRTGTTGILWNAKIMPLKALDKNGSGSEDKLGEAIRYAVDHNAKIIVMSLGLHRYSPYLHDIVQYAEENGVLLVAAAGNEGGDVKYPAAYPTVLAVGGIGSNGAIIPESNFGPELDLVAPWEAYTTAIDGRYQTNIGTSMAAPQVAAAAALVMAKYPDWKPVQVRNMLRQTAEDISVKGWDARTGFGILRIDRALTAAYKADMFEPNDERQSAAELPVEYQIIAELSGGTDQDWFVVQPAYKGTLTVKVTSRSSSAANVQVTLEHYDVNGKLLNTYSNILGKSLSIPVTGVRSYLKLSQTNSRSTVTLPYELMTSFLIYADEYEDNDRQYKAYRLQARSQVLTGTFHQQDDFDWFQLPITQNGTLRVKVSTDTFRIDPSIVIQRQGGAPVTTNKWDEGKTEYTDPIEVTPGTYYLLIKNVISDTTYPVTGTYTMTIEYTPQYIDPNEPNDRAYQAVMMAVGTMYNGVISHAADQDWFMFMMEPDSVAELYIERIPSNRTISLAIYDSAQKMLAVHTSKLGAQDMLVRTQLNPGMYYIRLTANEAFQNQMYGIKVDLKPLTAGFIDIQSNWARGAIEELVKLGVVEGYGDYTFRPDNPMMRSEAVAMIVRAFKLEQQGPISYSDVPVRHWAYQEIARATAAGIIRGYPDGTFRPNDYMTRVEMAQMLGNALKLLPLQQDPGFRDIAADYWAAGMLAALKQSGVLTGYPDGTFRPNAIATRAEFANLLYKALQL